METKIKKEILNLLFKEKRLLCVNDIILHLQSLLLSDKNAPDIHEMDKIKPKITHILDVLERQGLVYRKPCEGGPRVWDNIGLSSLGYKEFDPFHKKVWNFFQGPFLTILTITNTIISIAAVIVGWIILTK